jgi:hypothetical protein
MKKQNKYYAAIWMALFFFAGSQFSMSQSFDLFVGDKTPGRGKFAYGVFTTASDGKLSGTMTIFRHQNNPSEGYGRVSFTGQDGSNTVKVIRISGGKTTTTYVNVPLRKKTVLVYRASFRSDDSNNEFGAISR